MEQQQQKTVNIKYAWHEKNNLLYSQQWVIKTEYPVVLNVLEVTLRKTLQMLKIVQEMHGIL